MIGKCLHREFRISDTFSLLGSGLRGAIMLLLILLLSSELVFIYKLGTLLCARHGGLGDRALPQRLETSTWVVNTNKLNNSQ